MRPFVPLLALLVLAAAVASPVSAGTTPPGKRITWVTVDAPPLFILAGPNRGQGYGDRILDLLESEMGEYRHERVVANVGRHIYNLRAGQQVCSVGMFRSPERETIAWFSLPAFFTPPPALIVLKDLQGTLGGPGPVSLERLLADPAIRIGVAADRSYGPALDAVLEKYRGRRNLVVFSRQRLFSDLFAMVKAGRLDGVLGMPMEAWYHAARSGVADQVACQPLKEARQDRGEWFGYVACSRTEWGRQVIARIDAVLEKERKTTRYRSFFERWLKKGLLKSYRDRYDALFLHTGLVGSSSGPGP